MKKRLLSLLLALSLLIGILPVGVASASAEFSLPEDPILLGIGEMYDFSVDGVDDVTWSCVGDCILLSDGGHAIGMEPGIALVTAETADGLAYSVPVVVCSEIEQYNFADLAKARLTESGDATFLFTAVTEYEDSLLEGENYSPWKYVDGNTSASYTLGNDRYGAFFFSTTNKEEYLTFQIKVEQDGEYLVSLPHTEYGSSAPTGIYLAPIDAETEADIAYTDAKYQVMDLKITNGAGGPNQVTTYSDSMLSLSAGEYYLTFHHTAGRYLTPRSFRLLCINDLDLSLKNISLSAETQQLFAGETTQITAPTLPDSDTPLELLYYSKNPAIASVDQNGVVTANAFGSAEICAIPVKNPFVSTSIQISVTELAYDLKFRELGELLLEEDGSGDFKTAAFLDNYEGSARLEGSMPWSYLSASTLSYVGGTYAPLGVFTFSATTDCGTSSREYTVLTIKIDKAGQYLPAMIYNMAASAAGADVYIAPLSDGANKDAAKYLTLEISNADRTSDITTHTAYSSKPLNLPAGEYYLTFRKTNDAESGKYRYFYLNNFRLYRVGEYVPATGVTITSAKDSHLTIGETCTFSAASTPAESAFAGLSWSSSNESVATVKDGLVTAVGNGAAVITATTTDGSNRSASSVVLVGTTATYDYQFKEVGKALATGSGTGYLGSVGTTTPSQVLKYEDSQIVDGSAPWYFVDASTNMFRYLSVNDRYGTFMFNDKGTSEYVRLKIKIDQPGEYAALMLHNHTEQSTSANVYLAPVAEVDAGAAYNAPKYKIMYVADKWTSGAPERGFATTSDRTFTLNAGEYYLTFQQCGTGDKSERYLYLENFQLHKLSSAATVSTVNGAQMRTSDPQGLRFISEIDKTFIEQKDVVEYGTLLLPTASLDGDLVIGYQNETTGHSAAQVAAKATYEEDDDSIRFTAVLTNIKPKNYTRKISARAYAILKDGSVVYSDTVTSRSIYDIAKAISQDANASAKDKAAAATIIAAVDGE